MFDSDSKEASGLTLGRKVTGQQSIQDRKENTHCAICGEKGHWQGDDECQYSNSSSKGQNGQGGGGASNKSKTGKAGSKGKSDGDKSKKVFTVLNHDGYSRSVTFQETPAPSETRDISKIDGTNVNELCHFVVLDAACQRSCCSSQWMDHYAQILSNHRLKAKLIDKKEPFEFGHGPTQFSDHHAYLPTCFDGSTSTTCLLGAFIIQNTNDIPFLGSHSLLKKLQMVLDLPNNKARLNSIKCEVNIQLVNGHLALKIDRFSADICCDFIWKKLFQLRDDPEADVELLIHPKQPDVEQGTLITNNFISHGLPSSTTTMARCMAKDGKESVPRRDVHGDDRVAGRKLRLRPRNWLQRQDPLDTKRRLLCCNMRKAEGPCRREKIQRSGNSHGRYAKCLDCLMRSGSGTTTRQTGSQRHREAAISNSGGFLGEEPSPRMGIGHLGPWRIYLPELWVRRSWAVTANPKRTNIEDPEEYDWSLVGPWTMREEEEGEFDVAGWPPEGPTEALWLWGWSLQDFGHLWKDQEEWSSDWSHGSVLRKRTRDFFSSSLWPECYATNWCCGGHRPNDLWRTSFGYACTSRIQTIAAIDCVALRALEHHEDLNYKRRVEELEELREAV